MLFERKDAAYARQLLFLVYSVILVHHKGVFSFLCLPLRRGYLYKNTIFQIKTLKTQM